MAKGNYSKCFTTQTMFVLQVLCLRCDTNLALRSTGSAEMRERDGTEILYV